MKLKFALLLLLAIIGSLCVPTPAHAQFSSPQFVCGNFNTGAGTATSISCGFPTCTNTPPVGSLILVGLWGYNVSHPGYTATVSDGSNTYTPDIDITSNGTTHHSYVFRAISVTSSCLTYTANFSPSATVPTMWVYYWTGNATSSPVDTTPCNAGCTFTSYPATSSSVSVLSGDLLISTVECSTNNQGGWLANGGTVGTGYTHIANASPNYGPFDAEYQVASSAGSYAGVWGGTNGCIFSGGGNGNATLVAYKQASSSTATQVGGFIVGPMKGSRRSGDFQRLPYRLPFDRPRKVILEIEKI